MKNLWDDECAEPREKGEVCWVEVANIDSGEHDKLEIRSSAMSSLHPFLVCPIAP